MEQLLEQLYSGEGKLSLLLLEARKIADEHQEKQLLKFIEAELNGYIDHELPDYRKIKGEIIGTIKNPYGQIISTDQPLDFSAISEQVEVDLAETRISDGIGFIENALDHIDGNRAERPIPYGGVQILNDIFSHNNPGYELVKASHRFGTASVQFILTKVRQELTIRLHNIAKRSKIKEFNFDFEKALQEKINVFVTYSWETPEHNKKVISFVNFLRQSGFEATMDRKEAEAEASINFYEMMISGINSADKVIIILSKGYKEKADASQGGVWFEFAMILNLLETDKNKFIFVSFGQDSLLDILPLAISGREVLDLKRDQDDSNFNTLFAKLRSKATLPFSPVSDEIVEVKPDEIEPFEL